MKRYFISIIQKLSIILLVTILAGVITFCIIYKDYFKFIEMTFEALIGILGVVAALITEHEVQRIKDYKSAKESERLIMTLLEEELQQNIDIYIYQYDASIGNDENLEMDKKDPFLIEKWLIIQISLIQIKDVFFDKTLYNDITKLYRYFNRINYLINNKRILEARERKVILNDMSKLIWYVFDAIRKYNTDGYINN